MVALSIVSPFGQGWTAAQAAVKAGDFLFDWNGSIYLHHGTTNTELTDNGWSADISPDGSRVVFVSNRGGWLNLWLMNSDGSDVAQLTANSSVEASSYYFPRWSPDGDWIVFIRRASPGGNVFGDVYKIRPDGSGLTQLTDHHQAGLVATWSPADESGHHRIAYDRVDPDQARYQSQIWILNEDGSNDHRATSALGPFNDAEPAWSADGNRIYIASSQSGGGGDSIGLVYLSSSNHFTDTTVGRAVLTTESNGATDELPRVSADGSTVYFDSTGHGSGGDDHVFSVGSGGGTPTDLTGPTSASAPSPVGTDWPPTPPPGGTYTALGDSFSAGEGLYPYLHGTDNAWLNLDPPHSNRCHRSNDAYGPQLARDRSLGSPIFVACSGAITNDYFESNSEGNYHSDGTLEPAQQSFLSDATKTVTLTFGGNDVGFADVLAACVYDEHGVYGRPGCSYFSSLTYSVDRAIGALGGGPGWVTFNAKPIHPLTEVLKDILSQAPNAHIYVADYPQLFGNVFAIRGKECRVGTIEVNGSKVIHGDGIYIAKQDVRWLNHEGAKLNRVIQEAVREVRDPRVTYVPVGPRFSGHRLCDRQQPWIHTLSGTAKVSGFFPLYKLEDLWIEPGSFHPTNDGQKAYEMAFGSRLRL